MNYCKDCKHPTRTHLIWLEWQCKLDKHKTGTNPVTGKVSYAECDTLRRDKEPCSDYERRKDGK